ncbi:MAG: hypothetical protein WDO14_00750 [Bacteroidota bacterium]
MKASLTDLTHAIVKQYGRKKLRIKLEAIHNQLLSDPSFKQKILRLFQ